MESQKINISIVKEFFSTIKKSCKLIQKCSCFFVFVNLCIACIQGIIPGITIIVFQRIINSLQQNIDTVEHIIFLILFYVGLNIINELISTLYSFYNEKFNLEFSQYVNMLMLEKSAKLELKDYENSETYNIINRAQSQNGTSILTFITGTIEIFKQIISVITISIILVRFCWWMLPLIFGISIVRSMVTVYTDREWYKLRVYVEELAEVHLINSRLDISIEDILVALKQINIGRLIIHRHLTYKEKELLETQLEVFPEKINEKIIGNLDEEEILFDINIPIVLVTGISEYTNKFDVQIDLYSRFKKEGYSVGWIGSRKEAVLCGGESIPEWLYGTQLSFKDKIVYFNHYVKEYIEKNKNEVLIIGIPGEVCINDNYFIGHAGELATIISQAVNASATIVCMMFDENIEKKTKIWGNYIEGKLGVQIKCFAITNRLYDYNESDVVRKIKYTTLNNQTIQKMVKIFDGVYMISLDEEKDRLFDALIAELSEEENEL